MLRSTLRKPWRNLAAKFALVVFAVLVLAAFSAMLCTAVSAKKVLDGVTSQGENARVFDGQLCDENTCVQAFLFQGSVSANSAQLVKAALRGSQVRWVCMESAGGESDAANDLATTLHSDGVGTCVVPRVTAPGVQKAALCGSACSTI
jgi:hypothetical protein